MTRHQTAECSFRTSALVRRRRGRRMYQHRRARLRLHVRQPPSPNDASGTDASQMNATDVMLAEPGTAQRESMADENMPDALPVPSFHYARVVEALPGTPYMLTIAAQLAAMLRAGIRSGELAPNQPIPGEPTLMRQYGVARETARKAVRALVTDGLVYVVQGHGAYVATSD